MIWPKVLTLFLSYFVFGVISQGLGSGTNGNLRLCVVEGRGSYKRAAKFCPVLDEENANIECVIGTDRLDCLRRMSKGTVDFGVFNPEDLMAAQWANLDVLVTNELRNRQRPFERSIVAVVNRKLLPEDVSSASVHSILSGSTLCHPGFGADEIKPLSETLAEYLETLVTEKSCDENLSLTENRIKSIADFFGKACRAGPWMPDPKRDAELKEKYPSLCAACGSSHCAIADRYWGAAGALACLDERAGDVAWADRDQISAYFGLIPGTRVYATPDNFAYLCRDGSWQPLSSPDPCVWVNRPWPVVVSKRKAAAQVTKMAYSLTNSSVTIEQNWKGALAALLELNQALPEPLQPAHAPMDYLSRAQGFREAYSQTECHPPRHITFCTSTLIEQNKCEWMSEAAAVYGVEPMVQCHSVRDGTLLQAIGQGDCDVILGSSDWLVSSQRDYSIEPILHEVSPILEKMNTVLAYVTEDSKLSKMEELRGKRAHFPRFDGVAWHSVLQYLKNNKDSCGEAVDYFGQICAPGIEKYNVSEEVKDRFVKSCIRDGDEILEGDKQALQALVEGSTDVAFLSMDTYKLYTAKHFSDPWMANWKPIVPICPDDNRKFCFLSWSSLGHLFIRKNITEMKRYEILYVFSKIDQLFGKTYPFHTAMFSVYGEYNHQSNILFHNNTRILAQNTVFSTHPYNKIPLNFERQFFSANNTFCSPSELTNFASKIVPSVLLIFSLVFCVSYR